MIKFTLMTFMSLQYLNTPYRWGSNGPFSFDCSGLALKVLRDVGMRCNDMTAQNLYEHLLKKNHSSSNPSEDTIIFFGRSTEKITHVAIGVSDTHMIEAGGAGRNANSLSLDELAKLDARVRIKPIKNRSDMCAAIKINY